MAELLGILLVVALHLAELGFQILQLHLQSCLGAQLLLPLVFLVLQHLRPAVLLLLVLGDGLAQPIDILLGRRLLLHDGGGAHLDLLQICNGALHLQADELPVFFCGLDLHLFELHICFELLYAHLQLFEHPLSGEQPRLISAGASSCHHAAGLYHIPLEAHHSKGAATGIGHGHSAV